MTPQERQKTITRVTLAGSIVNLLLTAFKFVAGVVGHSSAMVADAAHSLSDLISDIIVIIFVKLSAKPQDTDHDYGHGRYETLASLVVGIILAIVGLGLLAGGIEKTMAFINGEPLRQPGMIALLAAILSVCLKEGLFQYTMAAERKVHSPALLANAWHHRSDALTSVATIIGIGGAYFLGPRWAVLDPVAAAVVSLFIINASYDLIRPNIDELLEKALPEETKAHIKETILSVPGIVKTHRLRTRRVGPRIAVEAHIKMDGSMTLTRAHEIATEAERRVRELLGTDTYVILHTEPIKENEQ